MLLTKRSEQQLRKAPLHIQDSVLKKYYVLEKDPAYGMRIEKRLFPKEYNHLTNLFRITLPNGWKMIYTLTQETIILEIIDHKDYERLFNY